MNNDAVSPARAEKLKKHLTAVLRGNTPLTRSNNSLFLEAICASPDAAHFVHNVVNSEKGLASLTSAMRFDLSIQFHNGSATKLLQYLSSSPEVASIDSGDYLRRVVDAIVDPPFFWKSFSDAFKGSHLQGPAQVCFAWLLLHLVSRPSESAAVYRELAQEGNIMPALLNSADSDARLYAQKIKHILSTVGVAIPADLEDGPGGRHDNDFTDFRQISILPTADELTSKEKPFLRVGTSLPSDDSQASISLYLDNLFRLYREDMLFGMREEVQVLLKIKKGKHRGFLYPGLRLEGQFYEDADGKSCKWGLVFRYPSDLYQFKAKKLKDYKLRQKFLSENRHILRHLSQTCLIVDNQITAFPTIFRNEECLAKNPPEICLQFEDKDSIAKTLLKLASAQNVQLIQINAPVFAYEHVLKALQETRNLPLTNELLYFTGESMLDYPPDYPKHIVDTIKANPGLNLRSLVKAPKDVYLDEAQASSLLAGLTRRLAVIQGPPGKHPNVIFPSQC